MTTEIQNNLEDLFHFSDMSEEERVTFLANIGSLVLESAILRFLTESDEDTADHFSHMVDTYADKNDLPAILAASFPLFGAILEEETESFRSDVKKVLGNRENNL